VKFTLLFLLSLTLAFPALAREGSGIYVNGGLSQDWLQNGEPLAYGLGVGYRFENGWRVGTYFDSLAYAGGDLGSGASYSYSLNDWLVQGLYSRNFSGPWAWQAGGDVDFLFGSRAQENVWRAPNENLSAFGASAVAGLAFSPLQDPWEFQLLARLGAGSGMSEASLLAGLSLGAAYQW
jgi:hypothetical protein